MSSADLTVLRYVKETAYGVTPTTPALKNLRYTGESIKYNITNTQTEELRADRTQTDLIQTGASVDGSINIELSYATYDDLLEMVFCNTYAAGTGDTKVLKNGVTRQSMTLQKAFPDLQVPEWHNARGLCMEALDLKFEIGKIVSGSFTVMGADLAQSESQITGATVTPAGTAKPMNAVTDLQTFMIDSVPYTGCINSLGLNVKNNARAIQCLGSLGAKDMKLGTIEVTGDMNLYFNDGSIYSKFVQGLEFGFSFSMVDDDGNKYTFSIPRAKFESGEVLAGGRNTDVMLTTKWRALLSSVTNTVISITADPVGT